MIALSRVGEIIAEHSLPMTGSSAKPSSRPTTAAMSAGESVARRFNNGYAPVSNSFLPVERHDTAR